MSTENQQTSPLILRLLNPNGLIDGSPEMLSKNPDAVPGRRLQADVPATDFDWLFKGVLSGNRGAQGSILNIIFNELIKELRKPEHGLTPYFNTSNESTVAKIVSRCSFGVASEPASPRAKSGTTPRVRKTVRDSAPSTGDTEGSTGGRGGGDNKAPKKVRRTKATQD